MYILSLLLYYSNKINALKVNQSKALCRIFIIIHDSSC